MAQYSYKPYTLIHTTKSKRFGKNMNEHVELNFVLKLLNLSQTQSYVATDDSSIDSILFYKLVIRHRVWFLIHRTLEITQPTPSTQEAINEITVICNRDKQHLMRTAAETIRISRLFEEHAIKHCFIKGILLNTYLYGALYTRSCSDIDVWVDISTYDAAIDTLRALGYQQKTPGYVLNGFKKTYYFKHRHDLAFYHPERKIVVELHFKLDYLSTRFFSFSNIKFQSIDLMNKPILTLNDNYHVLYLMIHGAIHAWHRLRWLHDITLYISNNRCDLDQVFHLAKQIECVPIVEQTLLLAHDLFQLHCVQPWIKSPSQRAIQLANVAKIFISSDYEMTDGLKNIPMFIKHRLYLLKLANRGKKIKALFDDFIKVDEVFSHVTFPKPLSFMYYVLYPLWVIRYIVKR